MGSKTLPLMVKGRAYKRRHLRIAKLSSRTHKLVNNVSYDRAPRLIFMHIFSSSNTRELKPLSIIGNPFEAPLNFLGIIMMHTSFKVRWVSEGRGLQLGLP